MRQTSRRAVIVLCKENFQAALMSSPECGDGDRRMAHAGAEDVVQLACPRFM